MLNKPRLIKINMYTVIPTSALGHENATRPKALA